LPIQRIQEFVVMKSQRLAVSLTVINVLVLMFVVFRADSAPAPDAPAVLLLARGANTSVTLFNKDGRRQVIKP
jgi:hypothetical protein